ncbi:MAG: hypothetical protein LC708_00255, partial [Actinobacteria bacterium]|nr:hypothetical protein [Actinomycetota bacterium]
FNLYGPNDPTCTGPVVFTFPVPVTGNGSYQSGDFTPAAPGIYRFTATYSGDVNNAATGPTSCTDPAEQVLVPAVPTLTTVASGSVPVGGLIHDTANLSGGLTPTGTITFNLFGPSDPNCGAAPIFSPTVPVAGNGSYDSPNFTVTVAGTYRFTASYSGDINNVAVGPTACADAAEAVLVTPLIPLISTTASGSGPLGGAVSDSAILSGGSAPTGTITFNLFGPDDAACANPPVFTATVPVTGNGTYPSGPFTPTAAGTYRFVASYSGDANNAAATTLCTDPAEAVVLTKNGVTITTTASATTGLGGPVHDTATLTGGTVPTGTITFNLYGPDNTTCTGPPVFTATVPVVGAGAYQSGDFTPTAPGTYRFVAAYSGDANNNPAGPTACLDAAEDVVVTAMPTITTTASASVAEGGPIHDTVNLAGGITPTGTITITLFGPGNATCAGPPIFTSTVPVAGNGSYQSGDFVTTVGGPTGSGTYRFIATYSGDANNAAAGPTACSDPAEAVVVTPVPPKINIVKSATPPTRVEPGGTFTFDLVITNPGPKAVTITDLTDNVYGPLSTLGTCNTAIGTVLVPGASYTCAFPGNFTGLAPDAQTDTATVTGVDNVGTTVTDSDEATVALTPTLPSIAVVKTASPPSLPEPGGTFTFSVVVTNTSIKPLTLTSLVDNVYGDLNGRGTCATGSVLAASGGTYSCSFPGVFNGVGGQTQTDTVTATGVDRTGNQVSAMDDA